MTRVMTLAGAQKHANFTHEIAKKNAQIGAFSGRFQKRFSGLYFGK